MEIAVLVHLGMSFERAESMSEYDRTVWIIALRQAHGEPFEWDQFRFKPPESRKA
jgi:hypothetical protein